VAVVGGTVKHYFAGDSHYVDGVFIPTPCQFPGT
jgi:hypothetical protein